MDELFLHDGAFIPEERWRSFVDGLDAAPLDLGKDAIVRRLGNLIGDAIHHRAEGRGHVGLLFSGGVDSTLIAFLLKRARVPFTCVAVGFQDGNAKEPEDLVEASKVAEELGLDLVVVRLNLSEAHALFRRTVALLGPDLTNVVNVGVGAVEVAGFEKGKALGLSCFFGGLGSEELFAGYDRHEKAFAAGGPSALRDECLAGLRNMWQRDLRREHALAAAYGIEAATPFLDEKLIRFSVCIPADLKIGAATFSGHGRGDLPAELLVKKLILREAAVALGLQERFAFRPKRAAQYGSRTNNALTMLADRHGFRDKAAYLASLGGSSS